MRSWTLTVGCARGSGDSSSPLRQGVAALKGLAALAHYGHDEDACAEDGYRGSSPGRNEVPVLAVPDLRVPPPAAWPRGPRSASALPPGASRRSRRSRAWRELSPTSVGVRPQATVMVLAGRAADAVADGLA